MKTGSQPNAFSLMELVVVMIIIGVVAAVAVPRFSSASTRQRAQAAARRIEADLNRLQRYAYQTSTSQGAVFDTTTHAYAMAGMPDPDKPGKYYIVSLADEPYQATIAEANFSGQPKFEYDGYGIPSVGGKVTIDVGGIKYSIIVDPETGRAYLE